jgi:hypothetical protein
VTYRIGVADRANDQWKLRKQRVRRPCDDAHRCEYQRDRKESDGSQIAF